MLQFTTLQSDDEIMQLLALQAKNQARNVSEEVARNQGFVTVVHNFDLLKRMNEAYPQIIAKVDDKLVGYAIVMPKSFRKEILVLDPMFGMIEGLSMNGKPLIQTPYYVMGQICVAEEVRGMGVFDGLYAKHKELMAKEFEVVITEIALRNTRSMAAHKRVGFETIHEYFDESNNEDWAVVAWRFF